MKRLVLVGLAFLAFVSCKTASVQTGAVKDAPQETATIRETAESLQNVLVDGRHWALQVSGLTAVDALRDYVHERYQYDGDIAQRIRVLPQAAKLEVDAEVVGLLKVETARSEFAYAMEHNAIQDKGAASALFERLVQAQAQFGFDGFQQNGCAAPTPYLLVLDVEGKLVFGIDLNPCYQR